MLTGQLSGIYSDNPKETVSQTKWKVKNGIQGDLQNFIPSLWQLCTNYLGLEHNGADSSKTVFTSKHLMLPTMALGLHSSCIHSVLDPPPHNEADAYDREFGEK